MENRVNKPRPKSATVRRPTTTGQSGLAAGSPTPPPLGRLKGLPVRPQPFLAGKPVTSLTSREAWLQSLDQPKPLLLREVTVLPPIAPSSDAATASDDARTSTGTKDDASMGFQSLLTRPRPSDEVRRELKESAQMLVRSQQTTETSDVKGRLKPRAPLPPLEEKGKPYKSKR